MISYSKALDIIRSLASSKTLEQECVPLQQAVGRICADDLKAPLDIQPFDNAAMDGFAVRLDDFSEADESCPVSLKRAGIIGAGQSVDRSYITQGSCWHVMTGAPIPAGTEAIIPVELAHIEGDTVIFKERPRPEQHIRRAGQDFKKGQLIPLKGQRISSAHILPLAALGIWYLRVFKKPRILFLSTGAEVVDDLAGPLEDGQIYNSNAPYAEAFLRSCGAEITMEKTIRDDPERFLSVLKSAETEDYDIVISSGAVSAGAYDFVKEGLEKFESDILYHKIKLKPGKPNLLARLPSGSLYFGLPGNPVATAVGLRFFVAEALRLLNHQEPERPVLATVKNAFPKKSGLHLILKGRMEYRTDGRLAVEVLDGQDSFMVCPFLNMNCWVHLPEWDETIKSGDMVSLYPIAPP